MSTKRKIEIGLIYSAKVDGTFLPVRIDKSLGHGRYEGVAMSSGKTVKISTDAIKGAGETVEQRDARKKPKDDVAATVEAVEKGSLAEGITAPAGKKRQPKAAAKTKEMKGRKPSGLDAAVVVLAEAKQPLNTTDMVKRMLETGLWKTNGKTPAATIYAAIIREISVKGDKSRFRKTDRGHFELTAAAKEVK